MIAGKKNKRILVADIGGTNARFALASLTPGSKTIEANAVQISDYAAFPCAEFNNPLDLILRYLENHQDTKLDAACLAVAGPVRGNSAYLTNLGWDIDGDEVGADLVLNNVVIANDFQALARSVTALDKNALLGLHDTEPVSDPGPVAVMGPGTGFGLSLVLIRRNSVAVIPTEGGHASFVPHGELETAVWNEVHKSMGRVTVETLMSGIGLLRIYRAICSLRGLTPLNYEPSTISQLALDGSDPACVDTLSVFCSMLGGVAADVALTQGATGGVFLGGGILPKISDFVQKSRLMESFLDKPPMEGFVAKIPVNLIIDPEAALVGACLLAADRF